jgi:hypothetical protein
MAAAAIVMSILAIVIAVFSAVVNVVDIRREQSRHRDV